METELILTFLMKKVENERKNKMKIEKKKFRKKKKTFEMIQIQINQALKKNHINAGQLHV